MTIQDFLSISWHEPEGRSNPLIEPPALSPLIADPTFLFPEETPDGCWRLWAHSIWGLHRFDSSDGLDWSHRGLVRLWGMRPFARRTGPANQPEYVLLYERYRPLGIPLLVFKGRPPWHSRIELCRSNDSLGWSDPMVVLRPELPWTRDSAWGAAVSNPCLVADDSAWRLYFSASLVHVPDCGFEEPRYIGMATRSLAAGCTGPYESLREPLLDPALDRLPGVLGAGSVKVLRCADGWIGLQNKIYEDAGGVSRSAIFTLSSTDGLVWTTVSQKPLLAPDTGWRASHVYACDCRYREMDKRWYLFYNARDLPSALRGRERIGLLVGEPGA